MPLTDEKIRAAHVGEVTPLNGRILLVDYDPRWAEQFEREAARIRAVLAEASRIEHVGPTSVPGLPAKPILDIVLVMTDSADEAAYLPAPESTGYRLHIRESDWYDLRTLGVGRADAPAAPQSTDRVRDASWRTTTQEPECWSHCRYSV